MRKSDSSLRLDSLDKELAWVEGLALAEYWGKTISLVEIETKLARLEARLNVLPDVELIANAADAKIKAKAAKQSSATGGEHG